MPFAGSTESRAQWDAFCWFYRIAGPVRCLLLVLANRGSQLDAFLLVLANRGPRPDAFCTGKINHHPTFRGTSCKNYMYLADFPCIPAFFGKLPARFTVSISIYQQVTLNNCTFCSSSRADPKKALSNQPAHLLETHDVRPIGMARWRLQ
jgi:hypothetical protein